MIKANWKNAIKEIDDKIGKQELEQPSV